jgi:hypothetical protein
MSHRSVSWLAWSLWAMTIALVIGGLILGVANHPEAPLYEYWFESTLIDPTFATLGALIVSRRPGNVIGWIFCAAGLGGGIQFLFGQYATVALLAPDLGFAGGAVAAWLSMVMQFSVVAAGLFLILLFPTGTLLSPRWRVVEWIAGTSAAAALVSMSLQPGQNESLPFAQNPFGIEGAAWTLGFVEAVGGWIFLLSFIAGIVSLVLRFLRSRGEERLQLKWFVYAATLGFVAILFGSVLAPSALDKHIGTLVWTLAPLGLPISAGIAILKYRLYEIDILINRTLVYGTLTVALIALYFSAIVVLQRVFVVFTGQKSTLAVVASTLLIAALFNPLRRRIQSFIDRRFYRHKYDAQKTLESFGARLRQETDLDDLGADLVSVVRETMQPAHVALWLREPSGVTKPEVGK